MQNPRLLILLLASRFASLGLTSVFTFYGTWGGRTHPCSDSARVFFHFVDK